MTADHGLQKIFPWNMLFIVGMVFKALVKNIVHNDYTVHGKKDKSAMHNSKTITRDFLVAKAIKRVLWSSSA